MRPHNYSTPEHFWSRIDKSGDCWIWQGARLTNGYGALSYQGKRWHANLALLRALERKG